LIVDCHVHLTPGGQVSEPRLISAARRYRALLCCSSLGARWVYDPPPEHFRDANTALLREMSLYPDLLVGFCYVNPRYVEASLDELDRCVRDGGMLGVKFWVGMPYSDPAVDPVVERIKELKVPILAHAWHKATGNLPGESTPEDVAALAGGFPDVPIVMAHLGGDWERGIRAVRDLDNVFVDTGGSLVEAGSVEAVLDAVGEDRVVFGSDSPGVDWYVALGKVLGARISREAKEKVLFRNMAGLLGLCS